MKFISTVITAFDFLGFSRVYANLIRVMRSWRGRDEVDAMSKTIASKFAKAEMRRMRVKPSDDLQAWKISRDSVTRIPYPRRSSVFGFKFTGNLLSDWNRIQSDFSKNLDNIYDDDSIDAIVKLEAYLCNFNNILDNINQFKEEYKIQLNSLQVRFISEMENVYNFNKKHCLALLVLNKNLSYNISIIDKSKTIRDYMSQLLDNVIPYLFEKEVPKKTILDAINLIEDLSEYNDLLDIYWKDSKDEDRNLLRCIISEINKIRRELNFYSRHFKDSISDYLVEENVGAKTVYLRHDSAEGKALSRLRECHGNTDEWETVIKPGDEVDLDETFNWLEANGFA